MPQQTLAQMVRAKYPGAYDDLDDQQLEAAIDKKYPDAYKDLPRTDRTNLPASIFIAENAGMKPMPSHGEPTTAENLRSVLQWGGNVVSGMLGMGSVGRAAVENPGTTLATAALPLGLGAAARSAIPYVAPAARTTAAALENPWVSGGVGAVEGWRRGGPEGAALGALTGGAFGPRAARELRRGANRIDPPARQSNPNTVARRRIADGMSEAGRATSTAPAAPPRVAPEAPAAPSAAAAAPVSTAGSRLSPQRIRNEVGIAARRAGVKLSDQQLAEADALVAQGRAPADAVREVASGKPTLNAAESKEYVRRLTAGQTHQQAMEALDQLRALAAKLGTPSSETVRSTVAKRNATGRWPKD